MSLHIWEWANGGLNPGDAAACAEVGSQVLDVPSVPIHGCVGSFNGVPCETAWIYLKFPAFVFWYKL